MIVGTFLEFVGFSAIGIFLMGLLFWFVWITTAVIELHKYGRGKKK